jgi:hypothetical protein
MEHPGAVSGASVPSARDAYALIRRPRSMIGRNEPQTLDSAAQLVRAHVRVALRGVQVLVPEQLLDLSQVGAGAEQLGGEHVTQGVRRDALRLATPAASV